MVNLEDGAFIYVVDRKLNIARGCKSKEEVDEKIKQLEKTRLRKKMYGTIKVAVKTQKVVWYDSDEWKKLNTSGICKPVEEG